MAKREHGRNTLSWASCNALTDGKLGVVSLYEGGEMNAIYTAFCGLNIDDLNQSAVFQKGYGSAKSWIYS
ncbi:hypothetical protein [Pseudomonas sp. LT1P18]|uniref:hypothetical protein n=1 Tax=Pseudomonas arabinosi TaxID=3398357 RepID=UPI0039EF9CDF